MRPPTGSSAGRIGSSATSGPPDASYAEWMVAYQAGDASSFEKIYGQLAPVLRGYLRSLCADATRAEDLLQDSFLQIHRSRHTYQPSRPFRPWAFAIARHVYQTDCRSRSRRARHEKEAAVDDVYVPPEFERFAARDVLASALALLAPDRREMLVLHHAFGFSFAEIGRVLSIRAGTAKVRAHRALVQLRNHLGAQGSSGDVE